jgi:xanthine dehydrogenase accessory factor
LGEVAEALGYQVQPVAPDGQLLPDAAAVIVASHGRDEAPVLEAALAGGVPYVGLVASRKRGAEVLASLNVANEGALRRVHTPAGLDIGARSPQEIALSVFAQIVAERPRPGQHGGLAGPGAAATVAQAGPAAAAAGAGAAASPDPGPATATDPVCGMSVAVAEATPQLRRDGGIWYFCGQGCRQAFADDPARYLANHGAG